MPTLVLKNVPEDLHRRLKEQAKLNHRSMTGQAVFVLQNGTDNPNAYREFPIPKYTLRDFPAYKGKAPLTDRELDEAKRMRP